MSTGKKFPAKRLAVLLLLLAGFLLGFLLENGYFDRRLPKEAQNGDVSESPAGDSSTRVHFIDTWQSDCVLIETKEKTVLIDAGDLNSSDEIGEYLKKAGVSKIDLFVATHPHSDHIGSGKYVIENYEVAALLVPDIPEESFPTAATYENLLLAAEKRGTKLLFASPGEEFSLGDGAVLKVLGPVSDYGTDYNNLSVVTKLTVGEVSFLFTGDMEAEAETDLISAGADLSCTVLKVGHHGSSGSSTKAFLDGASPRYAVILCGQGNDYGHPHREVLDALENRGCSVFRTDQKGSIVFETDGESLAVQTER